MSINIFKSNDEKALAMSLWRIAREHYQVKKMLHNINAITTILMISQQSFELYIKGIMTINNIEYNKTHNLIENIKLGVDKIDFFGNILKNKQYKNVLQKLGENFIDIRYGIHKGIAIKPELFDIMDSLEIEFDKYFFETMKQKNPDIHYKDWSFDEYRKISKMKGLTYKARLKLFLFRFLK